MSPADFAMMADPTKNPQFRRPWTGPPPEKEGPGESVPPDARPADFFARFNKPRNTKRPAGKQALIDAANRLFAPRRGAP